jgi:hypothetical protein
MELTIDAGSMPEMRPEQRLARPGRTKRLPQAFMAGALLTVGMSFALPTWESRLAILVLCLPPFLLGAWCVGRTGLWIGPGGVVVRGFIRTRTVPLLEARAFAPGIHGSIGNGYPAPGLERIGKDPIPIFCFGREGAVWKFDQYLEELQPVCDELNALLRRVQAEAGQMPALSPPLQE